MSPRVMQLSREDVELPDLGELAEEGKTPAVPLQDRREVEDGELLLLLQRQLHPACRHLQIIGLLIHCIDSKEGKAVCRLY